MPVYSCRAKAPATAVCTWLRLINSITLLKSISCSWQNIGEREELTGKDSSCSKAIVISMANSAGALLIFIDKCAFYMEAQSIA
jgi:hypothetical protein